jgi:outer membrane protein assembly factor BamE (lipoprotein component of BamABCDE complex)
VRSSSQAFALLVVALVASGCQSLDVLAPQRSAALLNNIQVGMSQVEVIEQLGKPQREEIHGTIEFLFYQTVWQIAEEAKQRNPIAVRDGKVVGLGNAYLDSITKPEASWGGWLGQVILSE